MQQREKKNNYLLQNQKLRFHQRGKNLLGF